MGKVDVRAAIRHLHMAPTFKRSEQHQEIAYPVARIFMVIALNLTGCGLDGLARFHDVLFA